MATKKAPPKKTAPKKTTPAKTKKVTAVETVEYTPPPVTSTTPTPKNRKAVYALLAVLVLLLLGAYLLKDKIIVANVNGQYITYPAYIKELENQGGQQVLNQMVTEALIVSEAKKQGVTVPQEVIDQEIETIKTRIEAQGTTFDEALAKEGITLSRLQEQVRMQKLVQLLSHSETQVTDADIDAYMKENQDQLPKNAATNQELRTTIKEQLSQTKQQETTQKWLEDLKAQANIQYW